MKLLTAVKILVLSAISLQAMSQQAVPKGFLKGNLVLADSSLKNGYIKDEMRHQAAIIFLSATGKKIRYTGDQLESVTIAAIEYRCIRGEFFRVWCNGDLSFLQKISDAASRPIYNGAEAIVVNRTEGKPGDYFIYSRLSSQLQIVNAKNISSVAEHFFTAYQPAKRKALESTNDIAMVKDAVLIYNNRNNH